MAGLTQSKLRPVRRASRWALLVCLLTPLFVTTASQSSAATTSDPPPVTAGLQLWFEAESLPDADGAPVMSWPDQSGLGRDLSAFDQGAAPTMRRAAVNGRAALEFNGTGSLMKTYQSTFTINQPDTFFIVYKSLDASGAARGFVFDSRDSSARQVFGKSGDSQARLYANNDLDVTGITYPFASFESWGGTFNGTSSKLYRNGTLLKQANAGGSAMTGFTVGALSTSAQYGYDYAHIQVAEILLYTGALSTSNRQAVEDWLAAKYFQSGPPPPPTPPANTSPPAISGVAREQSTLTATTGTWTGTLPISYAFQWQRCDPAGNNCAPVTGATASTITLTSADVGSTMRAVVTATNTAGSQNATSQQSALVTAAGGGGGSQPPVTAGLQLWFEAESLPDADGAPVMSWPDQSGLGRDLSAFDQGAAPTMRRAAVNGRAALEFNGTGSLMKTYQSTFTINQPDTFFIVYKSLEPNPSGHEAYVWDSRDSSRRQLFGLGPFTHTEMYADIDIEVATQYPFPNYQIWSGTFQGTSSTVWKNGTLLATGNAGNSSMVGLSVGGLSTSAQYGYLYGQSLVAEILFYSGAMSVANRQAVTDWLDQKYHVITG